MNSKRVTIPDLARELGLSVGTVSNALNKNYGQVSAHTIKTVFDAADRLGYRRNHTASALRTGRHKTISLFVPSSVRTVQFYMEFTMGVAEAATQAEVDLLLATAPPSAQSTVKVDGALVVDWLPEISAETLSFGGSVPLFSAGDVPAGNESVPSLAVDYYGQTTKIVQAALKSGAKKPLMIAPDSAFNSAWSGNIQSAFADATNGAPIHHIAVDSTQDIVYRQCVEAYDRHGADFVLIGPQRFAGIAGLTLGWGQPDSPVPWLASCAGDPITELPSDTITAIDAHPFEFGVRSGESLLALINNARVVVDHTSGTPVTDIDRVQPSSVHWARHWQH